MGAIASEERLAQRAAGGDERALEAIYRRYHQDLYRFCLAMTGNAQDAQDALQNTMLKVLRALPGEERRIKLKPWLYRIARNEAIEVLRRRRDREELEPDIPAAGTVAETAETRERLRGLLDDLEQLPERQRAALLMRELSGCDFVEIAAAFGTSAAVARQTLYEARLGLRELEEGRERRCADVRRELSDGDGRVLRRRGTRAHLRDCPLCRAFQEAIAERERTLAGIAPLPLAASAGLLQAALGGQAGAAGATSGASIAGAVGIGAGQTLATSATLKSVATVAVAAVAVTAADRTGVIDVPLPGKDGGGAVRAASDPRPATAAQPQPDTSATTARPDTDGSGGAPVGAATVRRPAGVGRVDSGAPPTEHATGAPSVHPSPQPGNQAPEAGPSPPGSAAKPTADHGGPPEATPDGAQKGLETAAAGKPPGTPGPPDQPGEPEDGSPAPPPQAKEPPEGKGPPEDVGPPEGKGPPEDKGPPEGKGP